MRGPCVAEVDIFIEVYTSTVTVPDFDCHYYYHLIRVKSLSFLNSPSATSAAFQSTSSVQPTLTSL